MYRSCNLVPRALFPGFGGGAGNKPPPKPGKSALGTRLQIMEYLESHAFHFPGLDSLRWQWRIQSFRWGGGAAAEGLWGRSPRPWDKVGGPVLKNFFRPFGPQFSPKVTGGAGLLRVPPPWIRHWLKPTRAYSRTLAQWFRVSATEAGPRKSWNLFVGRWKSWKIKILFGRVVTADDKARTM